MTDELPDLTDLTVDEQKDELENLSMSELEELREVEERQTAIDNIDRELSNRPAQASKKDDETGEDAVDSDDASVKDKKALYEPANKPSRIDELEAKVNYLIEKCKTTSHEGFENYEN